MESLRINFCMPSLTHCQKSLETQASAPKSAPQASPPPECSWCHLRAGPSGATAHWYSSGEVYSYPGGQLLARLEGFEAVRARRESARLVHELSRRLLLFVDKEKGTPLVGPGGGRLGEVRTPYQHCTYRLDASVVRTEVSRGVRLRSRLHSSH